MPSDEALKAAKEILDVMSKPATGAYAFGHADKQLAEIIDRHMPGNHSIKPQPWVLKALLVEAAEMILSMVDNGGGWTPTQTDLVARLRRAAEEMK